MKTKELVFLFFLVFFFFLFEYVGWLVPLRKISDKWLVPVYQVHTNLVQKIKVPYDFISFSFSKSKYMKQLEVRYIKSLAELSELDKLREENTELRKLIENRDLTIEEIIIGAPITSLAYPAIGVGSESGVKVNNMVLFNGMLLGTIEEVDQFQSKVSLLSRSRKDKVLAKTESGAEGVVDGDGKNVLLTQVPSNVDLVDGERVVTVGQEGIERNVFIGTLRTIENNPSAPTQTAIVTREVAFYDVVFVEVKQ